MSISIFGKRVSSANISVGITGIVQLVNATISFIMVPLLMSYFSTQQYSIWVTMLSLITWIGIFDFGIGYSFKNKVTESLVDKDTEKINGLFMQCLQYYVFISGIMLVLFSILLNTITILSENKLLASIIYIPAILTFPLGISTQIIQGLRLSHINSLYGTLKTMTWVSFITYLVWNGKEANLLLTATIFSIINIIFSIFIFYIAIKKSKLDLPPLSFLKKRIIYDSTIITGLEFFVLQISSLLFFSMGNYYIYSNLEPIDTVNYDTINKIFTFYFSFFSVMISVYWAEIVFYKKEGNYLKLKSIYKNLLLASLGFSAISWGLTFFAPQFIFYWTKAKVDIKQIDCVPFALLVTFQSIAYVGAVFMNAFEKVKLQITLAVASMVLLYPLIQYGFQHQWGIATPPAVTSLLILPALVGCHFMAIKLIQSLEQQSSIKL